MEVELHGIQILAEVLCLADSYNTIVCHRPHFVPQSQQCYPEDARNESMPTGVLSFMIMASQLDAATVLVTTPVAMTTSEISETVDQRDIDKSNGYAEESVITRMMTSTLQYNTLVDNPGNNLLISQHSDSRVKLGYRNPQCTRRWGSLKKD